jgi:hypothetical protein
VTDDDISWPKDMYGDQHNMVTTRCIETRGWLSSMKIAAFTGSRTYMWPAVRRFRLAARPIRPSRSLH